MCLWGVGLLLSGALAVGVMAQSEGRSTFEVVSVKRSPPPGGQPLYVDGGGVRGNRWAAHNATLFMLIQSAYRPEFQATGQIVGGPSWAQSDRFDITATTAGELEPERVRPMLRAMLAERFKLVAHLEKRPLAVLLLKRARVDGPLGPQLRGAGVDCVQLRTAQSEANAPEVERPRPADAPPPCFTRTISGSQVRIESGGMTMAQLAGTLTRYAGRPVLDRTGLSGDFAVHLEFAQELRMISPLGPLAVPPGTNSTAPGVDAPSLFAAVQQQLGLKLEGGREPMDVLVIDRAEVPTPD